jgi:hypothetical protein
VAAAPIAATAILRETGRIVATPFVVDDSSQWSIGVRSRQRNGKFFARRESPDVVVGTICGSGLAVWLSPT